MSKLITVYHVYWSEQGSVFSSCTINEIGYFKTKEEAELAAKGRGWYGGNASIEPIWVTEIGGEYYQVINKPIKLTK